MGTDASKKVTAQKMTYQSAYRFKIALLRRGYVCIYLVTR
jgi:hypothetical protein